MSLFHGASSGIPGSVMGMELALKKYGTLSLAEVITTDPLSDIRRVTKVMVDFKIDAIPVVDENDIVLGMVSKTDIIRAVSKIPNFQFWA